MSWHTIIYMQGEEADAVFAMLYDIDGVVWSGPYAESIARTVEHLAQWDNGEESEHSPYTEAPWGRHDRTVEHNGYVLAWDMHGGYLSLNRETPDPVRTMTKREIAKRIKVCKLDHGGPHNSATVYGHDGRDRDRTCIRVHDTDTWIYSKQS